MFGIYFQAHPNAICHPPPPETAVALAGKNGASMVENSMAGLHPKFWPCRIGRKFCWCFFFAGRETPEKCHVRRNIRKETKKTKNGRLPLGWCTWNKLPSWELTYPRNLDSSSRCFVNKFRRGLIQELNSQPSPIKKRNQPTMTLEVNQDLGEKISILELLITPQED